MAIRNNKKVFKGGEVAGQSKQEKRKSRRKENLDEKKRIKIRFIFSSYSAETQNFYIQPDMHFQIPEFK